MDIAPTLVLGKPGWHPPENFQQQMDEECMFTNLGHIWIKLSIYKGG